MTYIWRLQGQVGWDPGQTNLVGGNLAHGRRVGTKGFLRPPPTYVIL